MRRPLLVVLCCVAGTSALVGTRAAVRRSVASAPAASCRPAVRATRPILASAAWSPPLAASPAVARVQHALVSLRAVCERFRRALAFSLIVSLVATLSLFTNPSGAALASSGGRPPTELVASNSAVAAKKYSSKDPKLAQQKRVAFFVMAGGAFVWAKMTTDAEDAEERVQVKKETKRLESMRKEYTDIDEGVVTDEDLLSSLKARLSNATKTDGKEDGGAPPSAGPTPDDQPPPPPPQGDAGGSAGLLDRPKEGDDPAPAGEVRSDTHTHARTHAPPLPLI